MRASIPVHKPEATSFRVLYHECGVRIEAGHVRSTLRTPRCQTGRSLADVVEDVRILLRSKQWSLEIIHRN